MMAAQMARPLTASDECPPSLLIIGGGELEKQLRDACAAYFNRTRFLGAIFDPQLRSELLFCSDIMVSPGYLGLNVVDSLAMGCPVATLDDDRLSKRHSPEVTYLVQGDNAMFSSSIENLGLDLSRWFSDGGSPLRERERIRNDFLESCSIDVQFDGLKNALEYAMRQP